MFDNEFTLVRQGGAGWQGSVEVVGFIHYHNTIEIPTEESWIIQGTVDPATGLPASLDGRLSSGTPYTPSHANVVLRYVRFTGQVAPVDPYPEGHPYAGFAVPNQALGGVRENLSLDCPRCGRLAYSATSPQAFQYTGGSANPSDLVRLIFERAIFDHNTAMVSCTVI